jgi:hypothetical protein
VLTTLEPLNPTLGPIIAPTPVLAKPELPLPMPMPLPLPLPLPPPLLPLPPHEPFAGRNSSKKWGKSNYERSITIT